MASDCLFCRIAAGEIPVKKVYEDDLCLAFPDINPQAPTHVLVIPKQHIGSHAETEPRHESLLGHLLARAGVVAREAGLSRGYRLVINTGPEGGQSVQHVHVHVLGGRAMGWPPG